MSGRSHSKATRLAATFLANLAGVDTAAATFGIDRRTVRSWTGTVDVPEDRWTAIRDVLLARGSEMAAKGDNRGLAQVLTGAGIAERNVRYGQLIAQRDGRRAAKASEDDAVERRWRRRTIRDEVDPTYWSMQEHRTGELTEPYLAAKRRLDYLRITRIHVIHAFDNDERAEQGEEPWHEHEPTASEHIGQVGLYYLLRVSAESTPDSDHAYVDAFDAPGLPKVTTAELDAMSDDDYRAFYVKLVGVVQAEADAWWPHYAAEVAAAKLAATSAVAPEPVEPSPKRVQPHSAPVVQIRREDRAEGALVGMGQPWQWHSLDD